MFVQELADTYRLRNLRSASSDSIRLWNISLRMFDRFLGRQATTDDFDDDVMARFVVWRRQTVSAGTVNRDLGSLLALWRWAHRTGQVARWPQVELEKVPNRTPIAWTQDEFNLLLSTAKQSRGFVGCVQASDWWTALL
jgi:site-specific recombinase XerD